MAKIQLLTFTLFLQKYEVYSYNYYIAEFFSLKYVVLNCINKRFGNLISICTIHKKGTKVSVGSKLNLELNS